MPLKIYSTLTRKKDIFKPIKKSQVNLFVCGPTVYDYAHLGHAKTYVQFDFIVKYLRHKGFKVFYLQNITDIDDKIIKKANEEKKDWKEIVKKYREGYFEDMKNLGIDSVNKYANATDYMSEIISQVKRLMEKGIAYKISDGYYFDLTKFKEYGKLAKRKITEKDDAVSRIDENPEKRNSGDFCLWKFKKENEPFWKSELGEGRPGWHIEDTAITEKYFGSQYDVHGGGLDLIFPHHEAEIAQMESISGKKPLVRYWMHTGFLKINKTKMSKSLGNFSTIKEILKKYSPEIIRYVFASTHYRKPLDFSDKILENAKLSYERLKNICGEIEDDGKINEKYLSEFEKAMDDDFNFSNALQVLWKIVRDDKANGKYQTIKKIDEVFGLKLLEKEKIKISKEIQEIIKEREKARKNKDWKKADELREDLKNKGYSIDDTEHGTKIHLTK
ncbi:MAG: cysteine--tRNA ligase [Nanoarchaeota archaeon]|nr:cysteine--tRNA ligase [Nanoarchaeota archaeon]